MQPAPLLLVPLVAVLSVSTILSLVRAVMQGPWASRINNVLTALMAAALVAGAMGWSPFPAALPITVFAWAALWFVLQLLLNRRKWSAGTGLGVAGNIYRAAMMAATVWIVAASWSGPGSAAGQLLGSMLTHLIGALAFAFAGAGWLLAAFATPQSGPGDAAVPRTRGIHEALMAAGLALSLFAMV